MSGKDRKPYLTATTLDQTLLNKCHDNLECRLEMVVDIETPTGTIHASDRNKYVGGTFYEALLKFPVINRTVGEWLSNELQFSTLQLELSNVDGRFSEFLPGGANYGSWINKSVTVKLGLAEQALTYFTIFKGTITDVAGFKRTVKSVIIIARDNYDKVNVSFPSKVFSIDVYPKIEKKLIGKIVPIIYGDWTQATEPAPASVPAFLLNGNDPFLTFKEKQVEISAPASPSILTAISHGLDNNDPIQLNTTGTLPSPFNTGVTYYVKNVTVNTFELSTIPAGASINTTLAGSGQHRFVADPAAAKEDLYFRVAENDLTYFDMNGVYLKRSEEYFNVPSGEITIIGLGNKEFTINQNTSSWVNGSPYLYESGDEFFCKLKGKDLGSYDDNIIEQAKDILLTYGGLVSGDFDSNWNTYRDKASPSQSSISTIKSRIWIAEPQKVMTYVLSMLEQVRLEAFIDRNLKVKINSLHFEDWNSAPSYYVRNWDVVKNSFQTTIDERNNFNAAQGSYNFLPDVNENAYDTKVYKNQASITQLNKRIAKKIVFPNLYQESDVINQITEILRLASATPEIISTSLTWRSTLMDIGEFVFFNVNIGSVNLFEVPAMIREIGFDPEGLKVIAKFWLMAMVPYPGYEPGFNGTSGGYNASIVEET